MIRISKDLTALMKNSGDATNWKKCKGKKKKRPTVEEEQQEIMKEELQEETESDSGNTSRKPQVSAFLSRVGWKSENRQCNGNGSDWSNWRQRERTT
jgi:hypothetical protein